MRLSDSIETFIKTLLAEDEPEVELKRNELAEYFGCAPSQINYVLATRFSPDHGYLIESRRGGGGYIRIVRIVQSGAHQGGFLRRDELLLRQLLHKARRFLLPDSMKDAQRARIFKAMLTSIARQNRTMP